MKLNLKDELIKQLNNIEITDDLYRKIHRLIVDWHVVNSVSFTEERLRNLYQALDLNDDAEYDKHIARQNEIRERVMYGNTPPELNEELEELKQEQIDEGDLVIQLRKSPDFIQKLQTHDGIGDAVVHIQNGVEIKREYPWGTDAENTVVEIKSTNREVYLEDEA